jgi:hypothetical protein
VTCYRRGGWHSRRAGHSARAVPQTGEATVRTFRKEGRSCLADPAQGIPFTKRLPPRRAVLVPGAPHDGRRFRRHRLPARPLARPSAPLASRTLVFRCVGEASAREECGRVRRRRGELDQEPWQRCPHARSRGAAGAAVSGALPPACAGCSPHPQAKSTSTREGDLKLIKTRVTNGSGSIGCDSDLIFCMPCSTIPSDGVALGPVTTVQARCGV